MPLCGAPTKKKDADGNPLPCRLRVRQAGLLCHVHRNGAMSTSGEWSDDDSKETRAHSDPLPLPEERTLPVPPDDDGVGDTRVRPGVYVLTDTPARGPPLVKIGRSHDLDRRVPHLLKTYGDRCACAATVEVLPAILTDATLEKRLHAAFKEFKHTHPQRGDGYTEWFEVDALSVLLVLMPMVRKTPGIVRMTVNGTSS